MPSCLTTLATWSPRRWLTAVVGAIGTFLLVGLATDVVPNPVFGRSVPVTDWALEVTLLTAALSGLLLATYVKDGSYIADDRTAKIGGIGGLTSFFAVGCPACNKIALLALGSTGAIQWFAPLQPYLAAAGPLLLGYAVRSRMTAESSCSLPLPRT